MKRVLQEYQCMLTVLGPVFVGSGKEFSKKEYCFLNTDMVGIVDMDKLYAMMRKRGLGMQFEKFMIKDDRMDLGTWMRENRISYDEQRMCMKYTLPKGDTVLQRGTKTQIMEHIKDPYGCPYIPGSTLKGMFRSVLLASDLERHGEKYRGLREELIESIDRRKSRNRYLSEEAKQIECTCYHMLNRNEKRKSDAVNDVMSGFHVSDSSPVSTKDLVLCQKVELHAQGGIKTLNLLRECIRPETNIMFTITIDQEICKYSMEDVMDAIKQYNEGYNADYIRAFKKRDILQDGCVLVGGGVGFVSKTMIYPLLEKKEGIIATQKIFENTNVPKTHKHSLDRNYGVSPHMLKCTRFDGRLLLMGLCRFKYQKPVCHEP